MSCEGYEQLFYTFREINSHQQEEVRRHITTCESCRQLLNDVDGFLKTLKKIDLVTSPNLSQKVMDSIVNETNVRNKNSNQFYLPITRYSLAAASIGILIMFCIEILFPNIEAGKIKGPISNIQGAIINSDHLRKTFSQAKSKTSSLRSCKNLLNNQVDINCVKEKLSKINL